MTYQRDPDPAHPATARRDDRSWGMLPVVLFVAAVVGVGSLAYYRMHDETTPRTVPTESSRPGTATPPATTPTPPTAPKQ